VIPLARAILLPFLIFDASSLTNKAASTSADDPF
jgi:hypothetical protein